MFYQIKGNALPIIEFIKSNPMWNGLLILHYKTEVDDENYLETDLWSVIDAFNNKFGIMPIIGPDYKFDKTFKRFG